MLNTTLTFYRDPWSDWTDEDSDPTMCLFDDEMFPTASEALEHLSKDHGFDFKTIKDSHKLDFYSCIRLINFIRRQTSLCTCYVCGENAINLEQLSEHMRQKGHFATIPGKEHSIWTDSIYLLPTYENDPLLMHPCLMEEEEDAEVSVATLDISTKTSAKFV